MFQSDYGGEFRSLTTNFDQNGIIFRNSSYTSEQNGLVERKHHHVVPTGFKLLAHSGVPFKY